jgi:hypothetical protein
MDADCISCGNCLKNCPNGSPRMELHSPVRAFLNNVRMSQAESVFISSFIGLSMAIYLIKDFQGLVNQAFGFENAFWNDILAILIFTGLSSLLFYVFSYILLPVTKQSQKHNFAFFGFFLIPYILFALFNLTSIHEVLLNGKTLYYNLTVPKGIPLPENLVHPLIDTKGLHLVQSLIIVLGSIFSLVFCWYQLQRALKTKQQNKIIALFGLFLLMISGFSLYLFIFL